MNRKCIVKQRDITDCGICCIESIIRYYGGYVPLEKLREDTYTDKSGTTAFHIVKTLIKYGFSATGIKVDEEYLDKNKITQPIIVQVNINGFNHFVVVYEINNGKVIIMDPAVGKKKMTLKEFNNIWTHFLISICPNKKILIIKKPNNLSNAFIKIILSEKKLFKKLLWTSIILTIVSVISSFYIKYLISYVEIYGILNYLIIIIFLILISLKILISFWRSKFENFLNNNIDIKIIIPFLKHLFSLPLNYIANKTSGEIIQRVDEMENIKNLFSKLFVTIFLDLLLATSSMFILYKLNSKLFIVLMIIMILYLIISLLFSPLIYRNILKSIDSNSEYKTNVIDYVNGFLSFKNINSFKYLMERLENKFLYYLKTLFNFNKLINVYDFIRNYIYEIGLFLINTIGCIEIINHNMDIIDLMTFNTLMFYLSEPIKNVIEMIPEINYIKASISKISEFNEIDVECNKGINFINGDIVINNLSYSYNDYNYVINNLSLVIKKGNNYLLKGSSGCGKSTLCKLLFRLFDYQRGNILIGGINIKDISINDLRNNIAILCQKENLFNDTIKNNIILDREINTEYLIDILRITMVDKIINQRSLRLESMLTDNGFNLSGGERQRVLLARTLMKSASIIILDEALSEVSYDMEKNIINNIIGYFKDKTIIYVSHRHVDNLFKKVININKIELKKNCL